MKRPDPHPRRHRAHLDPPNLSKVSFARTAEVLRADIATWMRNPGTGPGGSFLTGRYQPDPVEVVGVLTSWLANARERITRDDARIAIEWLSDTNGIDHADLLYGAGIIGHPDAADCTLAEAIDHYSAGGDVAFVLYLLMLSGALVATVGNGDPGWLR